MWTTFKLIALGLITLLAAIAANYGRDLAYQLHAILILAIAGGMFVWTLRQVDEPKPQHNPREYMDDVVRAGVIATAFWGAVGFLAGTYIAFSWLSQA